MNMSIECMVTECKYNSNTEKYCMLNKIKVVKREEEAIAGIETTDCSSFEIREESH